ncbi:MAG: molybdopterin-dependent oxidoreductase [Nitrospinota bacterium]|nr:molybdopterin-dependent oxidoreductase [Nitrospinota bacterium]
MDTATQTDMVTLTIDGKTVTVPKGTVVVDAAKKVDIEIPVFCYHEKLGPFGCCRMCLVEVEKMPKMATACTLAVGEGMVVKTNTDKVEKAQKGVLEFTLLNHPLDCPVCDKGGECPLQDNTFKFGPPDTRMEYNRFHRDKATPLSPVITIDRERCIACQRCTRYSDIIEKDQALVMRNRGFQNRVSTFNDEPYDTRFSGNVIDICPVGALTNTDFRFSARSWDLTNASTLCGHCACNCNMTLGTRLNEMKRITTRPNDLVDDGWICDKARWGYGFTKSKNRIAQPRNQGHSVGIQEACTEVAASLKKIVEAHGPNSVGFIGSGYGLNEDLYSYQKLFRMGLGTNNIDHKTYSDTTGLPVAHFDLLDVETSDLVVLIASDPTEELPILDLRLKKAVTRKGVSMIVLTDQQTLMDKYSALSLRYNVGSDGDLLAGLNTALQGQSAGSDIENKTGVSADQLKACAEKIKSAGKVCVIYNPAALTGSSIHTLKQCLATAGGLADTQVGAMPAAPVTNAVGAMDMGVLPDVYPGGLALSESEAIKAKWGDTAPLDKGLSALEMIEKAKSGELKALVVYRSNPVNDFPSGHEVGEALKKLDLLVVHDMMETETAKLAHIVLPSNGPGFDEGTTTNIGGRVQLRTKGLTTDNPADWKIVSMIAKVLGQETAPKDVNAVTAEIAEKVNGYQEIKRSAIRREGKSREAVTSVNVTPVSDGINTGNGLVLRVADVLFSHDKILDAESDLAHQFQPSTVHLNEKDATGLGVKEGDEVRVTGNGHEVKAEVRVSNRCNPGGVVIPKVSDEQGLMFLVEAGQTVSRVTIRK